MITSRSLGKRLILPDGNRPDEGHRLTGGVQAGREPAPHDRKKAGYTFMGAEMAIETSPPLA
jgi:hypothetical protein